MMMSGKTRQKPPTQVQHMTDLNFEKTYRTLEEDFFETGFRWVEIDPERFQDLCESLNDPDREE